MPILSCITSGVKLDWAWNPERKNEWVVLTVIANCSVVLRDNQKYSQDPFLASLRRTGREIPSKQWTPGAEAQWCGTCEGGFLCHHSGFTQCSSSWSTLRQRNTQGFKGPSDTNTFTLTCSEGSRRILSFSLNMRLTFHFLWLRKVNQHFCTMQMCLSTQFSHCLLVIKFSCYLSPTQFTVS